MVPRVGGVGAAAAAATSMSLRFILASWGATSVLEGRVEVGTPANSLPRAREAVFLTSNLHLSPYSSSSFHGPPLLAPLLAPFIGDVAHDIPAWQIFPFAAADAASACLLWGIATVLLRRAQLVRAVDEHSGSNASDSGSSSSQVPIQAALAFLWNPLSILACVGGSSGCLEAPAVLMAVLGGVLANSVAAGVGVAAAAYLAPHHALLLIPVGIMMWRGPEDVFLPCPPEATSEKGARRTTTPPDDGSISMPPPKLKTLGGLGPLGMLSLLVCTAAASAGLCLLSNASLRSCRRLGYWEAEAAEVLGEWTRGAYGFLAAAEDLSPNIGLWWYLITQVFDDFRPMFLFLLNCQAALLAAPLALRFPTNPLLLAAVHCCTSAMLRPYPCLSDIALYMGLLPLLWTTVSQMRHGLLLITGALWIAVLEPAIWHMWIHSAVANANFYYSVTLAIGTGHIILISDILGAAIRRGRLLAGKPLVLPSPAEVSRAAAAASPSSETDSAASCSTGAEEEEETDDGKQR